MPLALPPAVGVGDNTLKAVQTLIGGSDIKVSFSMVAVPPFAVSTAYDLRLSPSTSLSSWVDTHRNTALIPCEIEDSGRSFTDATVIVAVARQ